LNGTNISAVTQNNPRWTAFIVPFQHLYSEDILLADVEKPSELIGFSKKAEEFLKTNTEPSPFSTKDIELKPKVVRVKEIQDSINRRIAKITSYWSKGNKKNSLYLACGVASSHQVASFMSVCTKLKPYSYMFVQVAAVLEAFSKLVRSRFKRLIFEVDDSTSKKLIKDSEFLGCKVSEAVIEIADNWNTFVRAC